MFMCMNVLCICAVLYTYVGKRKRREEYGYKHWAARHWHECFFFFLLLYFHVAFLRALSPRVLAFAVALKQLFGQLTLRPVQPYTV